MQTCARADGRKIRTAIRIGICLPEACDTLSLEQYKSSIEVLAKFELPEVWKESLNFDSMLCLPDEMSSIRRIPLSGRIYLCVVGLWLALVLVASVLYEFRPKRSRFACLNAYDKEFHSYNGLGEDFTKEGGMERGSSSIRSSSIRSSLKIFKYHDRSGPLGLFQGHHGHPHHLGS